MDNLTQNYLFKLYFFPQTFKITKNQTIFNNVIKHKLRIPITIPNNISFSPAGLNIKLIKDSQDLTLIKLLISRLSNPKTIPITSQLITSIQNSQAIWLCPICHPENFKLSWLTYAASIAKNHYIQICPKKCPYEHPSGHLSIGLLSNKLPKKSAIFCFIHNIKTLSDLLVFNSTRKLSWHEFSSRTGRSSKGPQPIWFSSITNSSKTLGSSKAIPNLKALFWANKSTSFPITIIKIRKTKYIHSSDTLIGRHYIINLNNHLSKCTGCSLNINSSTECTFSLPKSSSISLWTYKQNNEFFLSNPIEEITQDLSFLPSSLLPSITIHSSHDPK